MRDSDGIQFLQWALPQLGLRWHGFRRVRRQVCRRVAARLRQLGLADTQAYKGYLARNAAEWSTLEAMCGITISRFYRDRAVFDCLSQRILPELAQQIETGGVLRVWSAGCASGEEPYSVALIWQMCLAARFPQLALRVLATDRDPQLLARAARACYRRSSLRELPLAWVESAFCPVGQEWCLKPIARQAVSFEVQDLRRVQRSERFQLILCRNLAFSYFDDREQRRVLQTLFERLAPHGYLVIGTDEPLPDGVAPLKPVPEACCIYRVHEAKGCGR